ncbi:hypothetical protein SASPL_111887 [Salvia splendens]|uniref:Uncharacterized protein n=1 Tax=Salvia splendens TaxID=180675 RepID=A0A8X8Y7Q1_SALSN|nr:hypothetical protein SASPL_111887 [Salvia splendens]
MDGWMAGLGAAQPPTTDALGQLLSEYARSTDRVPLSRSFTDISGTLATEAAEDSAQVAKLRSALESVDHKRRKVCIIARWISFSWLPHFSNTEILQTLFTRIRFYNK